MFSTYFDKKIKISGSSDDPPKNNNIFKKLLTYCTIYGIIKKRKCAQFII